MRGRRHRATEDELIKITVWVSAADWEWLQFREKYGASAVVRELIRRYRRECEGPPRGYEQTANRFDLSGL
jgi:hypothetical protein